MKLKSLIILACVLALLCLAAWAGLKSIPFSAGYSLEAEFDEFPPNDLALEEWLSSQPGIAKVLIGQRDGEPRTLVVWITMGRNGWGPQLPDLDSKCDELGYKGRKNGFRHSEGRDSDRIRPREAVNSLRGEGARDKN